MNILTLRIHLELTFALVFVQELHFEKKKTVLELQYDVTLHVPGISYGISNVFLRSFLDDGERKVPLKASSGTTCLCQFRHLR